VVLVLVVVGGILSVEQVVVVYTEPLVGVVGGTVALLEVEVHRSLVEGHKSSVVVCTVVVVVYVVVHMLFVGVVGAVCSLA
jgi:hypothetical protein